MNDRRIKFRGKRRRIPKSDNRERDGPRPGRASQNTFRDSDSSDDNRRPPRHLKGKAIGLWYRDRNRKKNTEVVKNLPIPLELSEDKLFKIRKTLGNVANELEQLSSGRAASSGSSTDKYKNIKESAFKNRFVKSVTGSLEEKMKQGTHRCSLKKLESLDQVFKNELRSKSNIRKYNEMLEFRKKLPSYEKRDDIIDALEKTNAILISGETGCGKTTQVAQFILDHEISLDQGSTCHIICTQPRRISAISVAERVAAERGEQLGHSVGYQIRLEKVAPRERASILYCTTGVLLQFMHTDPLLKLASHIIIDEVHERDTLSDFVITLLRDILPVRSDLKVILMSATLNAEGFSAYFNKCPTVHIPGFTFPVTEYYLEDVLQMTNFRFNKMKCNYDSKQKHKEREAFIMPYLRKLQSEKKYPQHVIESLRNLDSEEINIDLIFDLIKIICSKTKDEEAILVFLPGWDKISKLHKQMTGDRLFPSSKYIIVPLHSMLSTSLQKTVFDRPPPGKRKIVIATNIAETSITIDDIVHVIDCGKIKMKTFDAKTNLSALKEEWVSRANARQRKGRAGRVKEGCCYHLFTRGREMMLDDYQLPEILRTRLDEVILQLKILQLGKAAPFLRKVLDPPNPKTVDISLKLLHGMRALDDDEDLTPLGYHLASLPIEPQAGKMLLFAAMFSCFDPVSSIAACLGFKDPFYLPLGKEKDVDKRKKELCGGLKSDHLLLSEVVKAWEHAESSGRGWDFCNRNFLSRSTLLHLRDMKQQFGKLLCEMHFIENDRVNNHNSNLNSSSAGLIKAILCAGLYPNIAIRRKPKNNRRPRGGELVTLYTPEDGKVKIHPKSVNSTESDFTSRFFVYFEKMKTSGIFLHDVTMVSPLALLFFCQALTVTNSSNKNEKILTVSESIRFSCSRSIADLIQELRKGLDWILEYKISHPGVTDLSSASDSFETRLLRAITELLTVEDEELNCGFEEEDFDDDDDPTEESECE